MKLLLDTHALLWLLHEPGKVSASARRHLAGSDEAFVSIATLWEMANKVAVGKLHLSTDWSKLLPSLVVSRGVKLLQIEPEDCARLSTLPVHHRDPFDRMLVAQALQRRLAILSVDEALEPYGVKIVW